METQPNGEDGRARRVAHEVDALIAEREAELASLREQRDAVERHFHVRMSEDAEARAQAAIEERRQLDGELVEAAEQMFSAIAAAQGHFQAAVEAFNEAIEANGRVRDIGRQIAPAEKLPLGLALNELVSRFGGRISTVLRKVKIPGMVGPPPRLGSLELPAEAVSPKGAAAQESPDWRAREERAMAPAVQALLNNGRN